MGRYINKLSDGTALPAKNKAQAILNQVPEAIEIGEPNDFVGNLVCVVENFSFDAAGYAFDKNEMNVFKRDDGRKKRWLVVPGANELADK